MNDTGSHGRSSIAKAAAFGMVVEALVGTAEVVINATEAEMTGEGGDVIGDRPGTAGERSDEFTEGEVEAFDEGGFDLAGETEGELDVLRLLAQGKSNIEIANVLVLSDKTVRNHISAILDKLDLANRVEAATYATGHGIQSYRTRNS